MAQDVIFSASGSEQDLSLHYLRLLFGDVEGTDLVGSATGTTGLKIILTSFNQAVMTLGAIIIIYSMLVSTIKTAHEGEMLGREWSSVWIPMRAAMGFALMLPVSTINAASYSVIQVFVMWVVIQGVYAANYLWGQTIDAISTGQAAISSANASPTDAATLMAQQIFVNLVCQQQAAKDLGKIPAANLVDDTYKFGLAGVSPSDVCGSLPLGSGSRYQLAINQAVAGVITTLRPVAQSFIQTYEANGGDIPSEDSSRYANAIMSAGGSYKAAVGAAASADNVDKNANTITQQAKEQGWIQAGAFYLLLGKMMFDSSSTELSSPTASGPKPPSSPVSSSLLNKLPDPSDFTNELKKAAEISTPKDMHASDMDGVKDFATGQLGAIQGIFVKILYSFADTLTGVGNDKPVNPLFQLMTVGHYIIITCIFTYMAVMALMVALSALAYGVGFSIAGFLSGAAGAVGAVVTGLQFFLTPFVIAVGIFFVIGLTWSYYLPLIPFLIFTLGAIGWLMLVIEAMVAAPLMALGILHPEGKHTVFGEAHTGIMIIAGVFLRPSLMIVGFMASLIMSYVVVYMISIGFIPAVILILGGGGSGVADDISTFIANIPGVIILMTVYTMLIVVGLNKAFSLVHVLPDRVMRWIGQPGEQTSMEELREMKAGAKEAGGMVKDSGAEGVKGAQEMHQEKEQSMERESRAKAKLQAKKDEAGEEGSPKAW